MGKPQRRGLINLIGNITSVCCYSELSYESTTFNKYKNRRISRKRLCVSMDVTYLVFEACGRAYRTWMGISSMSFLCSINASTPKISETR